MVGLGGLEPPASPLSGVRSNHLSYRPMMQPRSFERSGCSEKSAKDGRICFPRKELRVKQISARGYRCLVWASCRGEVARKEVIQPHLPIRLPCYDFTPVIDHTVVGVLLAVRLPASGAANSHGVTGGVYKARERIHRDIADSRLLAIPTSWSRVADSNPDWDRFSGIGSASRLRNPLYRPL